MIPFRCWFVSLLLFWNVYPSLIDLSLSPSSFPCCFAFLFFNFELWNNSCTYKFYLNSNNLLLQFFYRIVYTGNHGSFTVGFFLVGGGGEVGGSDGVIPWQNMCVCCIWVSSSVSLFFIYIVIQIFSGTCSVCTSHWSSFVTAGFLECLSREVHFIFLWGWCGQM